MLPSANIPVAPNGCVKPSATEADNGVTAMLLNAGEQVSVVLPDTMPLAAVISVGPPIAVQAAWPLMAPIEAAVALPEVHCTCVYRGPIGP